MTSSLPPAVRSLTTAYSVCKQALMYRYHPAAYYIIGSCLWKKLLKPLIDYFFVKILLYFSYFAHVVRFNICSILFVHLIMVLITHFVVICLHYQTRKPWRWWCIFFLQDFILSWHMKNSGKHFLDAKITLFNFKLYDALMD